MTPAPAGTDRPPAERYDVALLDLDGVVYLGRQGIPGAAEHLAAATRAGMRLGYVTNNAARSPVAVAETLTGLGVPAEPDQVITSAQTAARVLADGLRIGACVLVVGTDDLAAELRLRDLQPVRDLDVPVDAVVQGYSPDTGWRDLAAACRAVRDGAWWVASNADATVPSAHGPLPGNGAFVDVVRRTTGREPTVTGKPEPSMHQECLDRTQAREPIVVGDRLDTDIEGAGRVGCPSLLVLTGVTGAADLLAAPAHRRPTYLAADLGGLLLAQPEVRHDGTTWTCRSWTVTAARTLTLVGAGDSIDALRALCGAAWSTGTFGVAAPDATATRALAELGLPRAES